MTTLLHADTYCYHLYMKGLISQTELRNAYRVFNAVFFMGSDKKPRW